MLNSPNFSCLSSVNSSLLKLLYVVEKRMKMVAFLVVLWQYIQKRSNSCVKKKGNGTPYMY